MTAPTVLIIDDDESVYEIVESALSFINVSSIFAVNATTGIKFAQEHQPQLILMDLLLPSGMKGWEAIAYLKSDPTTQHIPVVAFTAASGQYIKQAMQAGASEFIIKPFTITQFQRTVMQYVGAAQR